MRLMAFIAEARVAKRVRDHLGEDSTGRPLARAQAQQGPDYGAADPIYPERVSAPSPAMDGLVFRPARRFPSALAGSRGLWHASTRRAVRRPQSAAGLRNIRYRTGRGGLFFPSPRGEKP